MNNRFNKPIEIATVLSILLFAPLVQALEFRTISENAAITYDAPSVKSNKLFVLNRFYPVEIVVVLDTWIKVRDATGALSWIEKKYLSDFRTVLITVPVAQLLERPDPSAPVLFQAEQNIIFEVIDAQNPGWVKVKHRDGNTGYVRVNQVWGV